MQNKENGLRKSNGKARLGAKNAAQGRKIKEKRVFRGEIRRSDGRQGRNKEMEERKREIGNFCWEIIGGEKNNGKRQIFLGKFRAK